MYCVTATNPDGSSYVIYDPLNAGSLPVLSPRETDELNEAGSLEFALVYGHEAYGQLIPKKTYITVELDGQEIFYGRVINAEPSPLTSQIQYSCAGALSLLQDSEVLADGKKSDGSSNSQTMTAQAFFEKCIQRHNADVNGDTRRTFQIGTVNHPKRTDSRTYQISSNVDTLSAIKQFILDYYGGFLRVRKGNNGVHLIDWVEQYGATDEGTLDLGNNIISMANRFSAENVFTSIRPVGANGVTLPNNGVMDVFSQAEMAEYGRIVKTVQFNSADTEAKLRAACQDMIDRMHKTMYISSEISLVDMHFVDGEDHGVNLGDVYTQISGLEGTPMTVSARNRDFNNPQNDSVSLKNPKQFDGNRAWDSGGSSSISKRSARSSAAAGMSYKYIHEFQDQLELNAKQIGIHAEELGLHADQLEITGNNIATLSRQYGEVYDEIGAIKGSAVLQNSDAIAAVAGRFVYDEINHTLEMMNGTEFRVHDSDGATITVGDRLTQLSEKTAQFEGSALWTNRDGIVGVSGEFDVVEKDGKRTLVIKSGGGMQVRRDNVEYGVYDSGNLTGGLMVEKMNDGGTATHLRGDLIDLTTNSQHQELASRLVVTEESIRSEVSAANSQIYSYIKQTASNIQTVITDVENNSYSYTNETASGIHRVIVNTTNQTWIQDTDPTTEAGGGHTPKTGDVWVKSTHQGTWDGAEGFDWEHDEQYNWFDIQGAQIYGWANDKWELVSDQQQTISWSEMIDTVDLYVNQKFKAVINDEGMIDIYMSKLQQTAEEIRSEVSTANSTVYSYISQTATNVLVRVGETPRTVVAKTAPTKINNRSLKEGDVWVESQEQANWDAAANYSWDDDSQIDWNQLRSNKYHVYHNGEWVEAFDGTTFIDDADIEVEHNTVSLYARKLQMVDGELQRYYAELKVGADKIKSQVNEYYNQLGSSITQTAREIRSDVFSDNSRLYSYISQTSTQIRLYVADEINDVSSSITQTASQIRSEVNAANSSIRSSITQTASSIRLEVRNTESRLASSITQTAGQIRSEVASTESSLRSSITQTATQIRSEVNAANSKVYSAITQTENSIRADVGNDIAGVNSSIQQTAGSIRSEVNAANSKIYSNISQTAGQIRSEVANSVSGLNSKITQTATQIRSEVSSAISGVNASITTQADRISLVVEGTGNNAKIKPASIVTAINNGASSVIISASHINLDGYVKATDLTTDYFSNKISNITNLLAQNVTVNWLGVKYNGTTYDAQYFVRALKLEQSGNTYTLSYARVRDPEWTVVGTFSRATSLSGAWGGSSTDRKTYTVSASPQGNTNSVTVIERLSGSAAYSNFSGEFGTQDTSGNFTKRGSVFGYLILSGSGSSSYVNVNTKSDGTGTNVARLSVGSLYTSGQTAGHDSVIGDEISLGSDQAYNGALTKKRTGITGYIWLKKKDGTWVRLRDFSIGLSFTSLGYKSAGTTITAANHYYYWSDTNY